MAKIAIIVGHAQEQSFCEALGEAYRRGAEKAGHTATLTVLAQMRFDFLREGYRREQPLEPELQAAYAALAQSDHWVLIFPLWMGDMPAILKAFIERVLQPDLVRRQAAGNASPKLFENTSARIIITMGMPAPIYRYWFGAHALKLIRRNILHFIGVKPVRDTLFGMIGESTPDKRARWLRQVEALGAAAA